MAKAFPNDTLFVIFGATGDLTKKKIFPALLNLFRKGQLPENFAIVGVARKEKTHEEFRQDSFLLPDKNQETSIEIWEEFTSRIYYFSNDFDTGENYPEMRSFLHELDKKHKTKGNRTFYLATLPGHFSKIAKNLKKHKIVDRKSKKEYRIIIEKPFGSDLKTAKNLNKSLRTLFREKEIFRIDHYLGKESVQNLFALRFANRLFESVWGFADIKNVQVTVAEKIGVENRGGYYDSYGALKDMVQNHLLQIMAIVAMEPPKTFSTKDIKDAKVKALNSIKIMNSPKIKKNVIFGQYLRGTLEKDYIEEKGVMENSRTETYAALKLCVNNKRWQRVPFYLRTGKGMKRKASEVVIYFKEAENSLFNDVTKPNILVIRLQPNEGIYLRFNAKRPGNEFEFQEVSMDFCHECLFGINTPEAYEKLLYDAFTGDSTLFTRWDEVEATWKIIDPIVRYWKKPGKKPLYYESGTWGPKEADFIVSGDNNHWREPL